MTQPHHDSDAENGQAPADTAPADEASHSAPTAEEMPDDGPVKYYRAEELAIRYRLTLGEFVKGAHRSQYFVPERVENEWLYRSNDRAVQVSREERNEIDNAFADSVREMLMAHGPLPDLLKVGANLIDGEMHTARALLTTIWATTYYTQEHPDIVQSEEYPELLDGVMCSALELVHLLGRICTLARGLDRALDTDAQGEPGA